jgi:hypothetical protein
MTVSIVAAVSVSFLLAGISYLIPSQSEQMPAPKPLPNALDQISSAILWIGIAVSIAIIVVGGFFLINRIKHKRIILF